MAIDLGHLRRYTGGDAAVEQQLFELFVPNALDYIAAMEAAPDDQAWHEAAHTLKGSARGIGAWTVADLAEAAEALVGAGQEEPRREQIAALRGAVDDVRAFIATQVGT